MKFGEKNIGLTDTITRAFLGILFLSMFVGGYVKQPWPYIILALGLIFVATSAYGTCPLYSLIGINTCKVKGKKK